MIFAVFLVLAVYAIPRVEVEALPEIDLPSLTVVTQWNGASPMAIQRSLTLPIEEAVRNLHGVESVKSTSLAGRSMVEIEFRRDIEIDFARLYLNEQLSSVRRNLPLNASQPQIMPFVPQDFQTENFFTFRVESLLSPDELRELAETWIVPQVLAIDGVADAQVRGGARPLLKILLNRERLDLYGIDADQIFNAINQLDELSGAGVIYQDGLERLVALRQPVTVERIERAVVAQRDGRVFRLGSLGSVRLDHEEPDYFVRANGQNVVTIHVEKRSGSNAVSVSRALRKSLPVIENRTPFEMTLAVDGDEGEELEDKLRELVFRSIVILCLLFLLLVITLRQIQLTAVVIASILFALMICLSLFYFLNLSVNFITISGLTICFGMLLDNSILVLDSIHRRLVGLERAEKADLTHKSKMRVAMETVIAGTGDVMFPIMATTLTTVVAFLSFIFLSGRLALYYLPLAISVGTAMFASVFVAFAWIPVVLNQLWVPRMVRRSAAGSVDVEDAEAVHEFVEDVPDLTSKPSWPQRVVLLNQRLWWLILPGVVALMVWGWFIYEDKVDKGGFFRMPDQETLVLFMRGADGTDVSVTSEMMLKFETLLIPLKTGAEMNATVFGNQAYMTVEFDDNLLHSGIPMLYRERLVEMADLTGGTTIYIGGFSETPYLKGNFRGSVMNSLLKVTGYNSKRLTAIAERTLAIVQRERRVRNARITGSEMFGRATNEETVITLRRDALAEYGLSVIEVVTHLRRLLGVDTPWNMLIDGEQERVQLSFMDADAIEFTQVAEQVVESTSGARIRLGDLLTMETLPLSDAIVRENQSYTQLVNWEYVGTDRMRQAYIKKVLDSMDLPYGYSVEESRQEFLTEQEESDLLTTIMLAAVFILMVMAALFESYSLPVLVLTSLPMALFGVFFVFWKSTTTFDSSAQIGLVLLFGVVVNNAILLVSRFRSEATLVLRARLGGDPEADAALLPGERTRVGGADLWFLHRKERAALLRRAIARGTLVRLRSILLTSGTTIVGLLPLLVQLDWVPMKLAWFFNVNLPFTLRWMDADNQDIWQNLALTSIGGLLSSTILILLAMPPLYYLSIRFSWLGRTIWASARIHFSRNN
jgi:HAE1 family hydrophobic/amphiphilic exporter-1